MARDLHGQFDRDPSTGGAVNTSAVLAAATSLLVVRPRSNRRRLLLTNDGTDIIYLAKADAAVINSGIRLNAAGGWYEEICDQLGYIYLGPFAAISAGIPRLLICEEF